MICVICGKQYRLNNRSAELYSVLSDGSLVSRSTKVCSRDCELAHTRSVYAQMDAARAEAKKNRLERIRKQVKKGPHRKCRHCRAPFISVPRGFEGKVAATPTVRVVSMKFYCSVGCREAFMDQKVTPHTPATPERFRFDNGPDLIYEKRLSIDLDGLEANLEVMD